MKRAVYISGLLTANLMMAGSLFKVQHWPGANVLIVLSAVLFCLVFLPVALTASYRELQRFRTLHVVTYIVFSLGVTGIVFKVMHWPGSGLLMQLLMPLPFVLFLPVYLYQTRHEQKISDVHFLGILFGLTFIGVFSVMLGV